VRRRELVTSAIRGLIKAKEPRNAWVLKRRLIIKFTTVEAWIPSGFRTPTARLRPARHRARRPHGRRRHRGE
jgi:hypothetical protein